MFKKIRKFFHEVRVELGKATWPWNPKEKGAAKYRELIDSTVVVLIAMLIIGAYISGIDYVLVYVVESLVGWVS
jgi:preprotein translocase subunit SecE